MTCLLWLACYGLLAVVRLLWQACYGMSAMACLLWHVCDGILGMLDNTEYSSYSCVMMCVYMCDHSLLEEG